MAAHRATAIITQGKQPVPHAKYTNVCVVLANAAAAAVTPRDSKGCVVRN